MHKWATTNGRLYDREVNTVEEQPATSATTVTPFISHEAIEDGQVAEVEEEEEYDTDSDTDYPSADNDEEDSLVHEVDECFESSIESELGMPFAICSLHLAFLDFAFFKHSSWRKGRL